VAAKGIAAGEMADFGKDYALQMCKNAKALASTLAEEGLSPLCEHLGYTESHQVVLDVSQHGGGKWVAETLEKANIITNKNLLPWDPIEQSDDPSGLRIGVSELTRLGMTEDDMKDVAVLYRKVILDKEDPAMVAAEVTSMRADFQDVHFCHDWDAI
jgi:glycine hydroxymethyltransferase